jgi:hypothetical protein
MDIIQLINARGGNSAAGIAVGRQKKKTSGNNELPDALGGEKNFVILKTSKTQMLNLHGLPVFLF